MEINKLLKNEIFEIVENQIRENNPKETNITFKRLIELGYTETESKQFISQCVALELFDVLKHQKTFNENRFIKNLKLLPKEPSS